MKLCSYIVRRDTGLAPNPFWGYCTLAVCTPNHMGVRLQQNDWIIGNGNIEKGNKLIYAMLVAEVLPFELYYSDPRFKAKKPVSNGTWQQRCGDNMYYKNKSGEWKQDTEATRHLCDTDKKKDLRYPKVFIAKHYYYFGNKSVEIPSEYKGLIRRQQGCNCKHDTEIVEGFIDWLQSSFKPGIHGMPGDIDAKECKGC